MVRLGAAGSPGVNSVPQRRHRQGGTPVDQEKRLPQVGQAWLVVHQTIAAAKRPLAASPVLARMIQLTKAGFLRISA